MLGTLRSLGHRLALLVLAPLLWQAATCAVAASATTAPSASSLADLADRGFRHLTPEQGLPNALVTSLAQDSQGFLWIGTLDGLSRWDGHRLKVFRPGSDRAGVETPNAVGTLHVDRSGALWVGMAFGGLLKFDASAQAFHPWPIGGQNGLSSSKIRQLAEDGTQGLWVVTSSGLDHVDALTGNVLHASVAGQWTESAGSDVRGLLQDTAGRIWLATGKGLFMRPRPDAPLIRMPLPPPAT